MGRASARTKWLVTLGAPVAALLLLELGLRLAGFEQPVAEAPVVIWTPTQDDTLDEPTALHQADCWSLWAPRPGALVRRETGERIGPLGFRGPPIAQPRDPRVLRIVLLGESSTFGANVAWEQTCAPQLVALLAARGVRAEVVNAGVIGHTARQGLGRYASAVRALHADVVVIAYGAQNEHAPCQGPGDAEKLALAIDEHAERGSTWLALRRRLRVAQLAHSVLLQRVEPELQLQQAALAAQCSLEPEAVGQLDWPGCRRVPLDDFEATLRTFCAQVQQDGARPVLCSLPRTPQNECRLPILPLYSEVIARVGQQLGVPVADVRAALHAAIASGDEPASFFIPQDAWHLGPAGQLVFAQVLAETLGSEPAR